eukprot:scaffold29672_cov22-Cyclotella_meneghiniana.AAC.2
MPDRKDSPSRSSESIGSGCGWHARVRCDTHWSGHGLMIVDDEEDHTQSGEEAVDVGTQKPPIPDQGRSTPEQPQATTYSAPLLIGRCI